MADLSDPRYWRPRRGRTRMSQGGRWSITKQDTGRFHLRLWPGGYIRAICDSEHEAMIEAERLERK